MKFSPGDKVSFINEKQNGTVIKTLSGGRVMVEIEDGFEFEVLENELVKISSNNKTEKKQIEKIEELGSENISSPLIDLCEEETLCIASVPAATGAVLTGSVNFYLINNTQFEIVYTFHVKSGKQLRGVSKGILEKGKDILLGNFRRDALVDVANFITEALFFFENDSPVITHIRKETEAILPGISQTNKGATGVSAFAKITAIYSGKAPEPDQLKDLANKFSTLKNISSVQSKTPTKNLNPEKYGIHINEKVIDLHIEEIYPDFAGLTNAEMISIQLKHFSLEMDNAIRNHFKKITFIHGVGNGILKREIRNELTKYSGTTFRDGDFSKYGSGATEVLF